MRIILAADHIISQDHAISPRRNMSRFSKTSPSSSKSFHSPPSAEIPAFSTFMVEDILRNAENIINKWDLNSSSFASIFLQNREESRRFLKSVNLLCQSMHSLIESNDSSSEKLILAQNLTQIAMKRLQMELHQVLSANKDHIDPELVSGRFSASPDDSEHGNRDKKLSDTVSDIKSIADCMVGAGYGTECTEIYKLMRKSAVDEGLYRLGIQQFRASQVRKMSRNERELAIGKWLDSAQAVVHSIFRGERILCDHVFAASNKTSENCFANITKEAAINMFRFPELIAECKGSPDQIHELIRLYKTIQDLWPEIESIFWFDSTLAVKLQALTSLVKLGKSVQDIMTAYESAIQKDSSKVPVDSGGVHPLTRSVMKFVDSLTSWSGTLSNILADHPHPDNPKLTESYFENSTRDDFPASPVSVQLAWTILVLLCKLDRKAELYKDAALSYLFLANNLHYIVRQVSTTNLKYLLGDEWITRHANKLWRYVCGYESAAWNKVLVTLPMEDNLQEISDDAAMDRLMRFNAAFEAEYRKQSSWIVPSGKLRNKIRASVARKLMPAYRGFCEAYFGPEDGSEEWKKSARFGPDDIGNYLADLFHGNVVSGS